MIATENIVWWQQIEIDHKSSLVNYIHWFREKCLNRLWLQWFLKSCTFATVFPRSPSEGLLRRSDAAAVRHCECSKLWCDQQRPVRFYWTLSGTLNHKEQMKISVTQLKPCTPSDFVSDWFIKTFWRLKTRKELRMSTLQVAHFYSGCVCFFLHRKNVEKRDQHAGSVTALTFLLDNLNKTKSVKITANLGFTCYLLLSPEKCLKWF